MRTIEAATRITLKNVLFLTDFSKPSEVALRFAAGMAGKYGAIVHALHALTPPIPEACRDAIEADEKLAVAEMAKVSSQLAGAPHDAMVVRGDTLWSAVEPVIKSQKIDLIVLGTHGRSGFQKLLLGSFAEEIFRRSGVPVLTIGPDVPKTMQASGRFQSVLFATDFGKPSLTAAPFAISLAEESDAQLILLSAVPESSAGSQSEIAEREAMHKLEGLVPADARIRRRPSVIVQRGDAATLILKAATEHGVDVIVLGVRDASAHLSAATHLERATAHKVVAHARCPVLTVRG